MAKFLLTDGYVSIAGTDLSDHAHTLDSPEERDRIDVSGFNSTGAKDFLAGSKDQTISVTFRQDFASSKVHAVIQPLFANSSTFGVEIRPTSGAVSATNPRFWGTASIFTYNGLNGEISNPAEVTVELKPATTTGFVWATS